MRPLRAGGRRRRRRGCAHPAARSRPRPAQRGGHVGDVGLDSSGWRSARARCPWRQDRRAPAPRASDRNDTDRYDPDMTPPRSPCSRTTASPRSSWAWPPRCSPCRGPSSTSTGGTSSRSAPSAPGRSPRSAVSGWPWSTASTSSSAPTRSSCPAHPTCTAIPSQRLVGALRRRARPRRPARLDLLRRVRAGRDRPARRPPRGDALALRRPARPPLPARAVTPDVLYVDGDDILTSAGTAAGIDLCLHLVRVDHGAAVANRSRAGWSCRPTATAARPSSSTARCPPARPTTRSRAAMEWALARLPERIGVDDLARRAHLSPRQFSRRFRDATGASPAAWLLRRRLDAALPLLESSDEPVERVAARSASPPPRPFGATSRAPTAWLLPAGAATLRRARFLALAMKKLLALTPLLALLIPAAAAGCAADPVRPRLHARERRAVLPDGERLAARAELGRRAARRRRDAAADAATGPFPTIVMMHGWGGDKSSSRRHRPRAAAATITTTTTSTSRSRATPWSRPARAASAARAASRTRARRRPATSGWVRLADHRYEGRDIQYMLGLLADQGVANPDAIGVTGHLLRRHPVAQPGPPAQPHPAARRLATGRGAARRAPGSWIAAAFPRWGASDLTYALQPNGRFLDFRDYQVGQSIKPGGVQKQSYVNGLYASGTGAGFYAPLGAPFSADITGWKAVTDKGEPETPAMLRVGRELTAFHSMAGVVRRAGAAARPERLDRRPLPRRPRRCASGASSARRRAPA